MGRGAGEEVFRAYVPHDAPQPEEEWGSLVAAEWHSGSQLEISHDRSLIPTHQTTLAGIVKIEFRLRAQNSDDAQGGSRVD
jgi:hypothetical protein